MECRMNRVSTLITLLLLSCSAYGQERSLVRKGNELYEQKKFAEAAAAYQKALQKQPMFVPGSFNLGNALIQQKQYEAARKVMNNTVKTSKDPAVQSGAQYNSGNTYMSEQQWKEAVEAYKQSLRKTPGDPDAQYNLSYALAKLKQQQQEQKDKDNKDKQQQPDKKDGKEDQPQPKDGQDKEKERPQPQPSKLSEQQADNLLKALQQDERKVQDKMQQGKASPVKMDKDW
jgi:tetratricopeptide (TPR) repeat protein